MFAVGHQRLSRRGRWRAAVLTAGDRAVLSHDASTTLFDVGCSTALQMTRPTWQPRRGGIAFHGVVLPDDEVTVHEGLRATTFGRTVLDQAATLSVDRLEKLPREGERRRLGDATGLQALEERFLRFLDEHDDGRAFEVDRTRDRELLVAGVPTVRVTWQALTETPGELEADLRALLHRSNL